MKVAIRSFSFIKIDCNLFIRFVSCDDCEVVKVRILAHAIELNRRSRHRGGTRLLVVSADRVPFDPEQGGIPTASLLNAVAEFLRPGLG